MIHRLEGILAEKDTDFCLLDVRGVGYGVAIPASTFVGLPELGEEVRLWTYLYVREDQLTLYGFATRQERAAFEMLLGASGIGPRTALAVLSTLSVAEWARAILAGNVAALTRVSGIGRKTAERMILDLKSKVAEFAGPEAHGEAAALEQFAARSSAQEQAIEALVALGASQNEARRRVAEAVRDAGEEATVETLVAAAMRAGRAR